MLKLKAMQKEVIVKYLLVISVISLSITLSISTSNSYKIPVQKNAFASSSPSFQREELTLDSGNWFDMIWQNSTSSGPDYADIQSVSYFSNGTDLSATLWLANFTTSPNNYENINYGMYFDADSNNSTGLSGIDYKIEVGWNNENRTWTRVFEEWSSNGGEKTLDKKENVTDFFEEHGSYITLTADLDSMLSPDNYRVLFYAEVINPKKIPFYWIIDSTNWISIPSPELVFAITPSPITLIQGGDSIAEVRINSSAADQLELDIKPYISENSSNSNLIAMKLDSEKLLIPAFGSASTHLYISITSDIAPTDYMVIMRANITALNTPLFAEPGSIHFETQKKSINNIDAEEDPRSKFISKIIKDQTVSKSSVFSIHVTEWKFEEQLNSFVNQWITPLTAIYTSISSIVAGILGWMYGRRRTHPKGKRNTYDDDDNNNKNQVTPPDK